tara:strand:- start:144 stop:488 length:345 start_codon:yes stop_codon:yes gene_type:complete
MNRKVLSLTALLAFSLSACGTPEGDLQEFCTIVETVLADESKKGNEEFAIGKKVSMTIKTDEVMDLLKSVADTKPKKAYKKLLKGAKKLGVEGYKCKAAKKYWKAQSKKKKKKK